MAPAVHQLADAAAAVASLLARRNEGTENAHQLVRRDHVYEPGKGSRPPESFNNKGYFALFALIGAGMVITSIWFFFWAKNGGFVWRRGDWDDYKSTVLRRKGPDGKTLSNATPPTYLGEKSIAGTFDVERDAMSEANGYANRYAKEKKSRPSRPHARRGREPSDEDLRAYRHEKPARVGGLNRNQDGSHFDFTSTEPSDIVSENSAQHLRPKPSPPKKKGFMERKREKKREKKQEKRVEKNKNAKKNDKKAGKDEGDQRRSGGHHARNRDSYISSDISGASLDPARRQSGNHDQYFDAYRPPAPPHAASRRNEAPRRSSGHHARQSGVPAAARGAHQQRHPGSFDAYSEAGSSDTGTKVYSHHIPQLRRTSGPAGETGFRRGARLGRRDSLSDSDEGDMGMRRK